MSYALKLLAAGAISGQLSLASKQGQEIDLTEDYDSGEKLWKSE